MEAKYNKKVILGTLLFLIVSTVFSQAITAITNTATNDSDRPTTSEGWQPTDTPTVGSIETNEVGSTGGRNNVIETGGITISVGVVNTSNVIETRVSEEGVTVNVVEDQGVARNQVITITGTAVTSGEETSTSTGLSVVRHVSNEGVVRNIVQVNDDEYVVEEEDTILLVDELGIREVTNISAQNRLMVQEKLLTNFVEPLVSDETLINSLEQGIILSNNYENLALQVVSGCESYKDIPTLRILENFTTNENEFVVVRISDDMISELLENDCVLKISEEEYYELFLEYAKQLLEQETIQHIQENELDKSSNDITSIEEVNEELEEVVVPGGLISPYQTFVTPEETIIITESDGLSYYQIYRKAVGWTWISDEDLNNKAEKWLTPVEFLTQTAYYNTNPLGEAASDCSEQANTLVSLLRSGGMSPANVRVVLGKVDFGDNSIGGHAWAEIYDDGVWTVLDPTSGPVYENGQKTVRTGTPYTYWEVHEYPMIEVWAYYNDYYYIGPDQSNAPEHWGDPASTVLSKHLYSSLSSSGGLSDLLYYLVDFFKKIILLLQN